MDDPAAIIDVIHCQPHTPRYCAQQKETLAEVRNMAKAWMELN